MVEKLDLSDGYEYLRSISELLLYSVLQAFFVSQEIMSYEMRIVQNGT